MGPRGVTPCYNATPVTVKPTWDLMIFGPHTLRVARWCAGVEREDVMGVLGCYQCD